MPDTPLAQWPYPDGSTKVADWDDALLAALLAAEKNVVLPFSTSTARDSAITSPTAGMVAYLTTPKTLTIYDGAAWIILSASGTYTPALTNLVTGTGGSAANTANWWYTPGTLTWSWTWVMGTSGGSVGTSPRASMPAGFTVADLSSSARIDGVQMTAGAASTVAGLLVPDTADNVLVMSSAVSGANISRAGITASAPGTWAAGNYIRARCVIPGVLT